MENVLMSKLNFVYQETGGIPYYAKVVGAYYVVEGEDPDYTLLSDYFDQIYNSLNDAERKLAKDLAILPRNCK